MFHFCRPFAAIGCLVLSASALLLTGCAGGGSSQSPAPTPTPIVTSPTVASVSPAKIGAGTAALTLAVTGTGFTSASTVQVGTVAEATTFVSATQLTATVPAAQLASGALLPVVVLNGSATSAGGAVVNLEVDNPAPAITSFTPSSLQTGSPATTVSITGTGFVPTTTVAVSGNARNTTFVSGTQVNTVLTAADLATAGTLTLTAVNGAPGGGTSSAASLPVNSPVVNNPAPTLISVAPATVSTSSSTPIPITVTGTNFVQGSVINVGTTAHATTFVNSTQLTSALTPYDIADPGKLSITVTNPASGGISNAGSITVTVPVPPQIANVSPGTFYVGATNATISVYGLYLEADCKILWKARLSRPRRPFRPAPFLGCKVPFQPASSLPLERPPSP